jgi:hypothetical protein
MKTFSGGWRRRPNDVGADMVVEIRHLLVGRPEVSSAAADADRPPLLGKP